jgi:signal transduction histidine kinase
MPRPVAYVVIIPADDIGGIGDGRPPPHSQLLRNRVPNSAGTVTIDSEAGRGATLAVRIPAP